MRQFVTRCLFLPTLVWNLLLGRLLRLRNWWDWVDDHLVIGALPFAGDAAALAKMGVTGVVNTCAEYAGPLAAYDQHGIEQLRLPTTDFTPPSLEHVQRGVDFITRHIEQGGNVYVHCKAGRGRSATVVVCWLIREKGMTPQQAQAFLAERRPHINKRLAEREVVRAFHRQCRNEDERFEVA